MAKRKNPKVTRSGRTSIEGHKQVGKQLLPPYLAAGLQPEFASWINERLPEMLWALLILDSKQRTDAFSQFNQIFGFIHEHEQKPELYDLTLTGIANMEEPLRNRLIGFIVSLLGNQDILSPMLLFGSLPGKEVWQQYLSPPKGGFECLIHPVETALWHQSQVATDCRWVRLVPWLMTGKMDIADHLTELKGALSGYPNNYAQSAPRVRALEIGLRSIGPYDTTWPTTFWGELWRNTPCVPIEQKFNQRGQHIPISHTEVLELRKELVHHWQNTHSTTAMDARHDAVFGMAFYSLRALVEMMGFGIGTSVLGRLGLRTLLEIRVSLKYLLDEDDHALWKKWRSYGAGQAKLNALRFDDSVEPPSYVDMVKHRTGCL